MAALLRKVPGMRAEIPHMIRLHRFRHGRHEGTPLAGDELTESRYVSSRANILSGDRRNNYLRCALLM